MVPMKRCQEWALPLFFVGLFLLVLVLVPGIGREANGARRWIPLGIINLQPSELMKVLMLLYAADYTVRKQAHLRSEEHTSELQSRGHLVCRLLLEKKKYRHRWRVRY